MGARKRLRKLDKAIAEGLELQEDLSRILTEMFEERRKLALRVIPKPRKEKEP